MRTDAGRRGLVVVGFDAAKGACRDAAVADRDAAPALRTSLLEHTRARVALAGAEAAAAEAQDRFEEARDARVAWEGRVAALAAGEATLAAARRTAAAAAERLDAARAELAALEAERQTPAEAGEPAAGLRRAHGEAAEAAARVAGLVADLRRRLAMASAPDPAALRETVAEYDATAGDDPDPAAVRLAERWQALDAQLATLAAAEPAPPAPGELEAAERRVAAAERHLSATESDARDGSLPAADRAAIEAAHQAVLDAEQAGGRQMRKRVADAEDRLTAVLHKAGFGSLLDYRVTRPALSPAQQQALFAAQDELRSAEAELRALQVRGVASAERVQVEAEQAATRRLAADLLGFEPAGHVADILRHHPTVPAAATAKLLAALAGVGVQPTDRSARATAAGWLAAWEEARSSRAALDALLAAAEARLGAHEETAGALAVLAEGAAQLGTPRRGIAAAGGLERAWARAEAALRFAVAGAEAAARHAEAAVADADAALGETEDRLGPVLGPDWSEGDVARHLASLVADEDAARMAAVAAEARLAAATAACDAAPDRVAPAGVPLVLLDPWDDVDRDLAEALADIATERLVVYATDRPGVVAALIRMAGDEDERPGDVPVDENGPPDDDAPAEDTPAGDENGDEDGEAPSAEEPAQHVRRGPSTPSAAAARRGAKHRRPPAGKRRRRR